jgi:hypothetical protein
MKLCRSCEVLAPIMWSDSCHSSSDHLKNGDYAQGQTRQGRIKHEKLLASCVTHRKTESARAYGGWAFWKARDPPFRNTIQQEVPSYRTTSKLVVGCIFEMFWNKNRTNLNQSLLQIHTLHWKFKRYSNEYGWCRSKKHNPT